MNLSWGTQRLVAAAVLILVLILAPGGCTRLLDHSAVQCNTDADCAAKDHHHPFCTKDHVCIPSGLAPADCFYGTPDNPPTTPDQFLNQCSLGFLPSSRDNTTDYCLSDSRKNDPDAGARDPPAPIARPSMRGPTPPARCKDLAPPATTVVYVSGSSNFQPLLRELAPAIVKQTGIVPVFGITTSCIGARSMNPTSSTYASDHYIHDPVAATDSYAQIFVGDGQLGVDCLLGAPTTVDVGESEIYPDTCGPPVNDPMTVAESLGPILPIVFVVPQVSSERTISYDAARQVFGGGGGVAPWEDPAHIFSRGPGTATLRLVAKELDLAPAKVWGTDQGSASAMAINVAAINDPPVAAATIGIIGADFYDAYRNSIKALAYQAKGQNCAYVPDSALTKDKINVRDGHYPLWGRIHFYIALVNNFPVSDTAQRFKLRLTDSNLDPEILEAYVKAGFVPDCAMKVRRETELGDLVADDPPAVSCACAFDVFSSSNQRNTRPECVPCTANADCTNLARPSCNYGYCEPVKTH